MDTYLEGAVKRARWRAKAKAGAFRRGTLARAAMPYLFIAPAMVCLAVFNLFPILRNLYLSLMSWDMVVGTPQFIGLENYRELFGAKEFWSSLRVTLLYSALFIPGSMLIGLFLALLMTGSSKINTVYRTVFFAPTVTSMVAMSAVWLFIFHPQYGTLNSILGSLSLEPVRWLNDPGTALYSLVMMNIWKRMGFCTVIYLGALLNVSGEMLEAADIDGAGRLQCLLYIKIPTVSPTTFMLIILMTIEAFQVFTQINIMTGGGPNGSTTNLVTFLFHQAFDQFRVGYGSAISILLVGIILLIYLVQTAFEKYVKYD